MTSPGVRFRYGSVVVQWVGLWLVVWCLSGCYPVNPPLAHYVKDGGYRFKTLGSDDEQRVEDETFVVLTFSGGGTRAAAFAYGALEALKETDIGGRSLLDEVDVISSVSGGSFASAYLGLFGQDAFFAEFPDAVLRRKLECGILREGLKPWNWPKLLSPYFGRGDLADQYYDASIFRGKSFRDLPRRRPFIVLNATDIGRGAQFSFTQESFDRICSDLDPVSVSRGVTASSAFPVAFTPLTLKNYGLRECRYEPPTWVGNAEQGDFSANPQRYDLAKTWRSYEDAGRRAYIHLSDGGLADNIGLRAVETGIMSTNSLGVLAKVNLRRIKRLVVIVVDAKPHSDACADRSARPPGVYAVLNAAATDPMENYSSDTVERFRLQFEEWDKAACDFETRRSGCDALATQECAHAHKSAACADGQRARCYERLRARDGDRPPHPSLYLMHVRFAAIPDSEVKQRLQAVDTRLQLPDDQVNLLITWGHRLVADSCDYRRLVAEIRGEVEPLRPCEQPPDEKSCNGL